MELCAPNVPSLYAWLQGHKGIIKRLYLRLTDGQNSALCMFLLGALTGGVLASLAWSEDSEPFDLGSWVLAFPRLQHIECWSSTFTTWRPLAGLSALTSLTLDRPDGAEEVVGRPRMHVDSLPASLRRLELGDIGELPLAVAAATQIEELYIRSPVSEGVKELLGPLGV